jgi:multidrug efflux pump subunit AcrA (membrane-fusion protein)
MSKKKKLTLKKKIILLVIAIILIIIFIGIESANSVTVVEAEPKIEAIEKRTIATSISSTGTIKTETTKNVTSTLTGLEIKSVNVKEGDKVEVGDVICTFNTETLEESLKEAQKELENAKKQSDLGIASANRGLDEAKDSKNVQVSATQKEIDTAKSNYEEAKLKLDSASSELESAKNELNNFLASTYNPAQSSYNSAKEKYNAKENEVSSLENKVSSQNAVVEKAKAEYDKLFSETNGKINQLDNMGAIIPESNYQNGSFATSNHESVDKAYKSAKETLSGLQASLDTANSELLTLKSSYESAEKVYSELKEQYESIVSSNAVLEENVEGLKQTVSTLKATYENLQESLSTTIASANSTIASMQDNVTSSKLSAETSTQALETQIKNYQEQIDKATLVSTVSGTVTSVNVEEGDIYSGATIAVIDGCEAFIVEAEIGEYDIPDVEVGMKVFIKTDATRDEELEGEVTYVATTSTSLASALGDASSYSTSSSATYKVKIAINTVNDRLRLGMNAKLSIVTEMEEDVWSVPYDAVYERDDGTHYIEISKDEDGTETEELDVEVGIEGSYYVQIKSSKLKDGMKVVVPSVESSDSVDALLKMMGADAGM